MRSLEATHHPPRRGGGAEPPALESRVLLCLPCDRSASLARQPRSLPPLLTLDEPVPKPLVFCLQRWHARDESPHRLRQLHPVLDHELVTHSAPSAKTFPP